MGTSDTTAPEISLKMVCSIGVWLKVCFHLSQGISCAESIQFYLQDSLSVEGPEEEEDKTIAPRVWNSISGPTSQETRLWYRCVRWARSTPFQAALNTQHLPSLASAWAHITQTRLVILTVQKCDLLAESSLSAFFINCTRLLWFKWSLHRHGGSKQYSA